VNYRHAYHAGNFADVVKHAVLALAIERLKAKAKPFWALDTHAGVGRYALDDPRAEKTGEWREGLGRLMAAGNPPAALLPYRQVVAGLNPQGAPLAHAPGSPWLIRRLLRRGDRLAACELHAEDAALLKALFAGDRQVKIHALDGYWAIKSFLPPTIRRGLVLVDPPFERADEFAALAEALAEGHRRWATGIFLAWYPIKDPQAVVPFHRALAASGFGRALAAEVMLRRPQDPERLNGCGLVLINPSYELDQDLETVLPWLAKLLAQGPGAGHRLEWLAKE